MTVQKDAPNESRFSTFTRWGLPLAAVLVFIALVGIATTQAESNNVASCDGDATAEACLDDAERHHGRRGFFGRNRHDPERARDRLHFAAGWMLKKIDVEEEARDQIEARLDVAFDDLRPFFEKNHDDHEAWMEAMLSQDQVDRDELEALRLQTMGKAEQASRVVSEAMADIAQILTPEQRQKLAERIHRHHRG